MKLYNPFKEIKRLRKQNAELLEALSDCQEELQLYEAEMAKVERDETVTHYHVNAKMMAKDILSRALQRDIQLRKYQPPVKFCMVSYNELKLIANSKIK